MAPPLGSALQLFSGKFLSESESTRSCWETVTATAPKPFTPGSPGSCTTGAPRSTRSGTPWSSAASTTARGERGRPRPSGGVSGGRSPSRAGSSLPGAAAALTTASPQLFRLRGHARRGLRSPDARHGLRSVPGAGRAPSAAKPPRRRPPRFLSFFILRFLFSPQPLMREVLEKKPNLTREEARDLIERCMKILYYRDARSFNRVSPGAATLVSAS